MKVSSQILLPGESAASPSSSGNRSDNGQFAGLVSASDRRSDAQESAVHRRQGAPNESGLADNDAGTLKSEQSAPATVRAAGERHSPPAGSRSHRSEGSNRHLAQERPPVAGGVPQGGKGLPVAGDVAGDPSLMIGLDTAEAAPGEGEANAEVITLVADVDAALAAPVAAMVQDQPQTPVIANAPVEGSAALTDGEDPAASGDTPETSAEPVPLRRDGSPRPGELDQLRGGRAQGLAWEQAQQTIFAPARQPASGTAQPSLGEVALAPEAAKDARDGASTAQILAESDLGEKTNLKSLKELREARLAAAPVAAAKVAPADAAVSPLGDGSSVARAGQVHPTGAAPSSPTDTSLAQLVDRLIETRVAARSERNQIDIAHPDFGRVTLAVGLRADDRLSVDLPGAPTELRHAVSQALAQQGAAQSSGQSSGQNSSQNGNQASSQRADGQAQAAATGGENAQNGAGHNSDPRRNTYEDDNPHLSIFAQSQAAGSDGGANKPAGGPASASGRGVLA